jgi:hypothetical protein
LKMGSTNPFNDNPPSIFKRIFHLNLYSLIPISLLCLYFNIFSSSFSPTQLIHSTNSTSPLSNSSIEKNKDYDYEKSCDYSNGDWVSDMRGPIYNVTTCGTIKELYRSDLASKS